MCPCFHAGLFHASWCLETVPVWPGACEPIVLEVQGSATVPPARGPQRQALERQLNESEKTAKVSATAHSTAQHAQHGHSMYLYSYGQYST